MRSDWSSNTCVNREREREREDERENENEREDERENENERERERERERENEREIERGSWYSQVLQVVKALEGILGNGRDVVLAKQPERDGGKEEREQIGAGRE
jgi:hypothetical protein